MKKVMFIGQTGVDKLAGSWNTSQLPSITRYGDVYDVHFEEPSNTNNMIIGLPLNVGFYRRW